MRAEAENQVAAPAELRTPNLHGAKIAQQRVRMEGWRQRRLGSKTRNSREEEENRLDSHRPSHGRTLQAWERHLRPIPWVQRDESPDWRSVTRIWTSVELD